AARPRLRPFRAGEDAPRAAPRRSLRKLLYIADENCGVTDVDEIAPLAAPHRGRVGLPPDRDGRLRVAEDHGLVDPFEALPPLPLKRRVATVRPQLDRHELAISLPERVLILREYAGTRATGLHPVDRHTEDETERDEADDHRGGDHATTTDDLHHDHPQKAWGAIVFP